MTATVTTTDTACVDCGSPADPYSPADDTNRISAGRRCNRCWLTDPADVKPSRIQAEQYAARAVVAYLAAV